MALKPSVRIVNETGMPWDTHVIDLATGDEIRRVRNVRIEHPLDSFPIAHIEFVLPEIDVVALAKTYDVTDSAIWVEHEVGIVTNPATGKKRHLMKDE